ncbi:Metallo-hydrolase/oxidoreductase [Lophium mytilinum]|uniref:Metallo-hydrolase/oxidoreductase n=1 Tax=Lophium mytilinum TaxID=390894 RepID=A0A6A6QMH0_9PEZI|nr:Metallo-hydrolase/oxidoreductase [Lophium mytilinum]
MNVRFRQVLSGRINQEHSALRRWWHHSNKDFFLRVYTFLLTHPPSNTTYLIDLGIHPNLSQTTPFFQKTVLKNFDCYPESPADVLRHHGSPTQQPEEVRAVLFTHLHFDHFGDGAQSGGLGHAELWMGPGSVAKVRPGYPENPEAAMWSSDLPSDGSRKIVEFSIPEDEEDGERGRVFGWEPLGAFERACDLFGDASVYLVDAPGHMLGHVMVLVRVRIGRGEGEEGEEDDWVLIAGDCFHHADLLREPLRTARPPQSKSGMHGDGRLAVEMMWRARAMAERKNVWVIGAHDEEVGEALNEGKGDIQGLMDLRNWREKGWKRNLR